MATLLNIDTATLNGAVAIASDGQVLNKLETYDQKDQAIFLHTAIEEVLHKSGMELPQIDAVVVTIGPGSYTGLRVGLSAAKGLCYALQKPLVAVNTLQATALAAIQQTQPLTNKPVLFVPMIDARRMEVFTAVYNSKNELHIPAAAVIIDPDFFANIRLDNFLVYAGDGSKKLLSSQVEGEYLISNSSHTIHQVAALGEKHYKNGIFENVAYCEPLYLKPFFSTGFVKK